MSNNPFEIDNDRINPWKTIKEETIHKLVIEVKEITQVNIDKPNQEPRVQPLILSSECVILVPFLKNKDLVLVEQFRHAINTWTIEVPGGMIDPGETPLESVLREAYEEVGIICNKENVKYITKIPASGSHNNEYDHIFVATDCELDDNIEEDVNRVIVKPNQLNYLLDSKRIPALSISSILLAKNLLENS